MQTYSLDDQIANYFKSNNLIFGNNIKLNPELQNYKTLKVRIVDLSSFNNGFIYLDILYPSQSAINQSKITWSDYNWKFRWFNAEIMGIDSMYSHTFSRFQKEFIWKPLKPASTIEN